MSLALTPDETTLAQACANSLPPLITARAAAVSPHQEDVADKALSDALTEPVRALCQKLQQDHQETTLATIATALQPYYTTPERAQAAAAQTDSGVQEIYSRSIIYGASPIAVARVAVARFTGI